jgi:hypothetical protein
MWCPLIIILFFYDGTSRKGEGRVERGLSAMNLCGRAMKIMKRCSHLPGKIKEKLDQ